MHWSCCLLQDVELGLGRLCLGGALRLDPDAGDDGTDDKEPREHVEGGLEAVVERGGTRRADPGMCICVVRGGGGGDRAHRGEPDCTAHLATGVDETGRDAGVRSLDACKACDREWHEREAETETAEHEGGEHVPEVVALDRQ